MTHIEMPPRIFNIPPKPVYVDSQRVPKEYFEVGALLKRSGVIVTTSDLVTDFNAQQRELKPGTEVSLPLATPTATADSATETPPYQPFPTPDISAFDTSDLEALAGISIGVGGLLVGIYLGIRYLPHRGSSGDSVETNKNTNGGRDEIYYSRNHLEEYKPDREDDQNN